MRQRLREGGGGGEVGEDGAEVGEEEQGEVRGELASRLGEFVVRGDGGRCREPDAGQLGGEGVGEVGD